MPLSTGGCFFAMRTIVFFDGQNLFHSAKNTWGPSQPTSSSPYYWASYDVQKLAQHLVFLTPGQTLEEIYFYTGVPSRNMNPDLYWFWTNKLNHLKKNGIHVYRGRISNNQEKGVDVSIAIDLIQATYEKRYEVAIIVSKDSDFGPAVALAKVIAKSQGRNLAFQSAFPVAPNTPKKKPRGISGTTWVPIDQSGYDACRDSNEYRLPKH